ncbi:hypothetical protein ACSMX9_01100 [Streptomyces sp. LE64]|uniref:hypothetical protein n=1 Tax=Streptomyces sp. LE64 TaxID=3448653 RepID=UPI0040432FEF
MPEPVATPRVWAGAVLGSGLLVGGVNQALGPGEPLVHLAVLSVLAAALGARARLGAVPGIACLCWLFFNAFGIPPAGVLTWSAPVDLQRMSLLLGAALTGTLVARVASARTAYRRIPPPAP